MQQQTKKKKPKKPKKPKNQYNIVVFDYFIHSLYTVEKTYIYGG